jgi:hypothetical protein
MSCNCGDSQWTAILDKMPPEKPRLRVEGTAECTTTGFTDVRLEPLKPQGTNPRILLMELKWKAPAGPAGDVITPHKVQYHQANSPDYDEVVIVNCGNKHIPVETVN